MTTAWALVRIAAWIVVSVALGALIPVALALLVLGNVLVRASFGHRDALVWVLGRMDRIALDASARSRR